MAGLSTGLKQLLTITPCTVETSGKIKVGAASTGFKVMINPSKFTHGFSIKENENTALGKSSVATKFASYEPETVAFDIVIDGTGVVNLPIPGLGSPDVETQVIELKKVIYKFDGEEHAPRLVRLLWGSFLFFGRLETMTMDYTLFKPSGKPLRAKITLKFSGYVSDPEESLKAKRASPDLNHIVEVKSGDTLPLLCYRIYKDSSYYADVAKVNNLLNFRSLNPGDRLHFPPLR